MTEEQVIFVISELKRLAHQIKVNAEGYYFPEESDYQMGMVAATIPITQRIEALEKQLEDHRVRRARGTGKQNLPRPQQVR